MPITITKAGSVACLICALGSGACSLQVHDPKPLDPSLVQSQLLARDPDDPALRDVLNRRGVNTAQWPLRVWDVAALTALAYELRDDLAQLRAERAVAEAARETARVRRAPGVELVTEHHSDRGSNGSPWTLGLVLDLTLTGNSRRGARVAQADARAREADWLTARRAWQIRAEVRDAHANWVAALRHRSMLAEEATLRREEYSLYERRLELGAVSAAEPARARMREAESARELSAAEQAIARSRIELAFAVGLPAETLERLRLDEALSQPEGSPASPALQRAALNDRLDVRMALESYAAIDAQLQLEIARQIPEFSIKPGYAWDQGDNRWSLGLSALLPLLDRNQGQIAEARARRDAEAARFAALQAAAIAELDRARQVAMAAEAALEAAVKAREKEAALAARVERRFASGDADRLERVTAQLALNAAARREADARAAVERSRGTLEDAVQRPLGTIPAPERPEPAIAANAMDAR
ncbi:MAG TPA: TolC family protein [Rhodocyclaceae bacterium]|nr:TolC family protein [Rhodocyclaceae bacterium]HNB79009.1 TolC family protein [Rhodocyclaceae bacterium]HNH13590.1 TolC family protein [Rhodocyclaceae bacterium]HNH99132.1 TolC family protein [Rhodocyclaceae bacterium]